GAVVRMDQQTESAGNGLSQTDAIPTSPKFCVLLVEDDRSARRYLEVTLQRSGYTVITAEDGLKAMTLALSSKFDAVVTDAIMPNLSGQQLARFLRNNDKLAHI